MITISMTKRDARLLLSLLREWRGEEDCHCNRMIDRLIRKLEIETGAKR